MSAASLRSDSVKERVWIVVPAFNENARVLRSVLLALSSFGYSIVVVDDGSAETVEPDLTGLPVHLLRHLTNLGHGAALQTGMDYALAKGAEIIVHFDADGQ